MQHPQVGHDSRQDSAREKPLNQDLYTTKQDFNHPEMLQRVYRRIALISGPRHLARKALLRCLGAHIGRGTAVPTCRMQWPHQVWLGEDCRLEPGIYFKFDWYWKPGPNIIVGDRVFIGRNVEFNIQGRLEIGDDCLIASGCVFVDHDHGVESAKKIADQPSQIGQIILGRDVWIGANSVILKNVNIGNGAVIGAGSVVTKPIPAKEIWAGSPARKLKGRE